MLTIKNLSAVIDAKDLLSNISLEVNPGEIHAILGPRRSGKSSLAHAIAGHPSIIQTEGSIHYKGKNLKNLDAEDRSKLGMYVSFQGPPELVGLTNLELAKSCLRAHNDVRSNHDLERDYQVLVDMLELAEDHGNAIMSFDDMSDLDFRKNELLLMLLLNPTLAIIDEIDQGMDDEELSVIGAVLSSYASNKNSMILITHSQKLLDMVVPTHVHILVDGEIREQGNTELYKRIIEDGYSQFS
jgi:Fe-S cluster assembly ATP-binding protein